MLQMMQKKVEAEGEKSQELYDKFMCYCKSSGGDLAKSISAAEGKVPQVGASIKSAEGRFAQLKSDVKSHQVDRSSAKSAMEEAVGAIEKGVSGFVQTGEAASLRAWLSQNRDMTDADRDEVLSFLSGKQGDTEYAPSTGEIAGLLK